MPQPTHTRTTAFVETVTKAEDRLTHVQVHYGAGRVVARVDSGEVVDGTFESRGTISRSEALADLPAPVRAAADNFAALYMQHVVAAEIEPHPDPES